MSRVTRARLRTLGRPSRCNYCRADAVVWVRYRSYLSPSISRLGGGWSTLYMASCAEHEGCVNWTSMLAVVKDPEVLRDVKDHQLRTMRAEVVRSDGETDGDGALAKDLAVALGLRRADRGDTREKARDRCADAWYERQKGAPPESAARGGGP
jgi:hypothetical protein